MPFGAIKTISAPKNIMKSAGQFYMVMVSFMEGNYVVPPVVIVQQADSLPGNVVRRPYL